MNDTQKMVLGLTAVVFLCSAILCPYQTPGILGTEVQYAPIFYQPGNSTLDFARLAITWVAILVAGALLFMAGTSGKKK